MRHCEWDDSLPPRVAAAAGHSLVRAVLASSRLSSVATVPLLWPGALLASSSERLEPVAALLIRPIELHLAPPRSPEPIMATRLDARAKATGTMHDRAPSVQDFVDEDEGEVFDIDDFTCATPFEKSVLPGKHSRRRHATPPRLGTLHIIRIITECHALCSVLVLVDRFVSVLEEQLHGWKVGVTHPHAEEEPLPAAAADAASPNASPRPAVAATGAPGLPLFQSLVSLSGRSFQLALYHSTPSFSHTNSSSTGNAHTRHPSSLASTSTSSLLSLPLRVDHVSASTVGHHPISVFFGVCSFLLLTPASTHVDTATIQRNNTSHELAFAAPSARRVSKNEASMLLSAVSVAANSAQCVLPCFVAVDEGSKQLYWGRTCYGSVVRFDARCADEIPAAFRHLTGLTDAFQVQRERFEGRGAQTGHARTLVAVSFGYQQETRRWGYNDIGALYGLTAEDEEDDDLCRWRDVSEDALIGFGAQWGPREDPLTAIRLTTAWPFFPEGTFVDNAVYSDLDGLAAPNWRVDVAWRQDDALNPLYSHQTPLATSLQTMIDVVQQGGKVSSLASVLGSVPETPATLARQQSEEAKAIAESGHPLSALRAVQSSLKAHIAEANKIAAHGESAPEEYIARVMKELLDAEHESNSPKAHASPPPVNARPPFPFLPLTPVDPFTTTPYDASPADPPVSAQLVPYGSLLSRFVFALLDTAESGHLTLRTVAVMWTELVAELRFHFETSLPIPKLLSADTPDFGLSILHQKVQLLQWCIRIQGEKIHRRKKAAGTTSHSSTQASSAAAAAGSKSTPDWKQPWKSAAWSEERLSSTDPSESSGWGDLDDLNFSDDTSSSARPHAGSTDAGGWGELDISLEHVKEESDEEELAVADRDRDPEGVESVMPDTYLLLTGAPLRIPVTQEVRVMTSDKFDEQQEMFARMGSSADSSRLRTEMQTAGLASDMQAFKAANPGCILEDFVRWHSPKDWRPAPPNATGHAARRGELSQRMRKRAAAEGGVNIWQKLWSSAIPVPAAEQKQLFDPAVEGEQILNYLENVEPQLLFSQLLGISLQNCIGLMARTRGVAEQLTPVTNAIQKLGHYLRNYNRGNIPQGQKQKRAAPIAIGNALPGCDRQHRHFARCSSPLLLYLFSMCLCRLAH